MIFPFYVSDLNLHTCKRGPATTMPQSSVLHGKAERDRVCNGWWSTAKWNPNLFFAQQPAVTSSRPRGEETEQAVRPCTVRGIRWLRANRIKRRQLEYYTCCWTSTFCLVSYQPFLIVHRFLVLSISIWLKPRIPNCQRIQISKLPCTWLREHSW